MLFFLTIPHLCFFFFKSIKIKEDCSISFGYSDLPVTCLFSHIQHRQNHCLPVTDFNSLFHVHPVFCSSFPFDLKCISRSLYIRNPAVSLSWKLFYKLCFHSLDTLYFDFVWLQPVYPETSFPSMLSQQSSLSLIHPIFAMPRSLQGKDVEMAREMLLLSESLPCELHMLNLRVLQHSDDQKEVNQMSWWKTG